MIYIQGNNGTLIPLINETDLSNYYTKKQTDTAIDIAKKEISKSIITESNEWKVIDEAGNIIFSVDASGAHTTALSLNDVSVATEDYVDNKEYDFFVIKSSVPGSTKKFKITIDDSGVLTASEIE